MNHEHKLINDYLDELCKATSSPLCMFWSSDEDLNHQLAVSVGPASETSELIANDRSVMTALLEAGTTRRAVQLLATAPSNDLRYSIEQSIASYFQQAVSPAGTSNLDTRVQERTELETTDDLYWLVKPLRFRRRHYGIVFLFVGYGKAPTDLELAKQRLQSAEAALLESAENESALDITSSGIAWTDEVQDNWAANRPERLWASQSVDTSESVDFNSADQDSDTSEGIGPDGENAEPYAEDQYDGPLYIGEDYATNEDAIEREKFLHGLVGHSNFVELTYALVNQLKDYLKVDRVSWIDRSHNKFRVMAVSSQPSFNKRGNLIRQMQALSKVASNAGSIIWSNSADLPPQLETPFESYIQESRCRVVGVVPIAHQPKPVNPTDEVRLSEIVNQGNPKLATTVAVLLIESMEDQLVEADVERKLEEVSRPMAAAAYTAKRFHDLPLMPLWIQCAWFLELFRGKTRNKAWAIVAAIVAVFVAMIAVPSEFRVRCEGELQPRLVRHVFEPQQARVVRLLVSDGQYVKEGDLLAETESHDLQLKLRQAETEYETSRLEAENLEFEDSAIHRNRDRRPEEIAEMRGKLEVVRAQAENHLAKVEQLRRELQRTQFIRAPIAGRVFAWNVQQKLSDRPVNTGDRLFSIASDDSDLILRLRVPDQRVGYVLDAYEKNRSDGVPTRVWFKAASDSSTLRAAYIINVSPSADIDSKQGSVLPVDAQLDLEHELTKTLPMRPGTTVDAKIVCGQASFGYCKLYEFFDWSRRTWFQYVY